MDNPLRPAATDRGNAPFGRRTLHFGSVWGTWRRKILRPSSTPWGVFQLRPAEIGGVQALFRLRQACPDVLIGLCLRDVQSFSQRPEATAVVVFNKNFYWGFRRTSLFGIVTP